MRQKFQRGSQLVARVAGVIVLSFLAGSGQAAIEIGVADIVVGDVYGRNLSKRMIAGEKLVYNQKVRTGRDSAATLEFSDKTRMTMGERAEMLLDDLVYDPQSAKLNGVVQLSRGILRFASAKAAKVDLRVRTPAATIGIRGTAFDVLADPRKTEVTVIVGRIQVSSQYGSEEVGPGQTYSVQSASGANFTAEQSAEMAAAIAKMLSMISTDQTGVGKQAEKSQSEQTAEQSQSEQESKESDQSVSEESVTPQEQEQVASKTSSRQPEAFYHAIRGKKLDKNKINLHAEVIPSGVAEVAELQYKGYVYVKP